MATYSAARAVHAALTASTVDAVTLTATSNQFAVVNRGADDISYLYGGAAATDPTELGDDTLVVPAGGVAVHDWNSGVELLVKLISSGAADYSVQAV